MDQNENDPFDADLHNLLEQLEIPMEEQIILIQTLESYFTAAKEEIDLVFSSNILEYGKTMEYIRTLITSKTILENRQRLCGASDTSSHHTLDDIKQHWIDAYNMLWNALYRGQSKSTLTKSYNTLTSDVQHKNVLT